VCKRTFFFGFAHSREIYLGVRVLVFLPVFIFHKSLRFNFATLKLEKGCVVLFFLYYSVNYTVILIE